jgi:hypothetical protein
MFYLLLLHEKRNIQEVSLIHHNENQLAFKENGQKVYPFGSLKCNCI